MRKLYLIILTTIFVLAVPVQTFGWGQLESPGIFKEKSPGENTDKDNSSDIDLNSGFFRVGSTENLDDAGGATKESELPSDKGNGIIIASIFFAASYMLLKIRKDKKKE